MWRDLITCSSQSAKHHGLRVGAFFGRSTAEYANAAAQFEVHNIFRTRELGGKGISRAGSSAVVR